MAKFKPKAYPDTPEGFEEAKQDLLSNLATAPTPAQIMGAEMTIGDMVREIEEGTTIGRESVQSWINANRTLLANVGMLTD